MSVHTLDLLKYFSTGEDTLEDGDWLRIYDEFFYGYWGKYGRLVARYALIYIETNNEEILFPVDVFDVLGCKINFEIIENQKNKILLDAGGNIHGVYFIKWQDKKNNIVTQKIILN